MYLFSREHQQTERLTPNERQLVESYLRLSDLAVETLSSKQAKMPAQVAIQNTSSRPTAQEAVDALFGITETQSITPKSTQLSQAASEAVLQQAQHELLADGALDIEAIRTKINALATREAPIGPQTPVIPFPQQQMPGGEHRAQEAA